VRTSTPSELEILGAAYHDSYWTLIAVFADAGIVASVAGTQLTVDGVYYDPGLISTSGLKASLGSSVDRVDVVVQNTDWRWTRITATIRTSPVFCTVGRAIRQSRDGTWEHFKLLSGIVVSVVSNQATATIQCISDLYAAPAVGALGSVSRSCRFKFKDPRTCGYSGATPTTCNKVFESADGCLGRNNQHRYGGFLYDIGKDTLYLPAPDPNSNPYQGGGGIGGSGEPYYKYDNPYLLGY